MIRFARGIPLAIACLAAACSLRELGPYFADPERGASGAAGGGGAGAKGAGAAGSDGRAGAAARAGSGGAGASGGGSEAGSAGVAGAAGSQVGDPCKSPSDCDDSNACTVDSCIGGACKHTPGVGQTDCDDDDDRCNGYGVCEGLVCKHRAETEPKTDDGDPCTINICDKTSGSVLFVAKVQATDSTKCLVVSCNPTTGAVEKQNLLDDGLKCTMDDCDLALGPVHTPKPTGDGDPCTADSCDPATGEVKHVQIPSCEGCNPTEEGKTEFICNDDNPCTLETCTKCTGAGCKGGICSRTILGDGNNVDDGKLCNGITVCKGGKPFTEPPVSIDDKDVCTIDTCNPVDGTARHVAVPSDDLNKCTTDTCDPIVGIKHVAVDADDHNACTTNDRCDPNAPGDGLKSDPIPGCTPCVTDADCSPVKCVGGRCAS